jgi:serine/threonine protein kinase
MRYRNKIQGLTSEGHFDERYSALYFVDIMHGLAYLHRNSICHRDIKPENILLCASGIVKIGDFGVSYCFEDENNAHDSQLLSANDNQVNGSTTLQFESDKALEMMNCYNSGILRKTEGTWCFWSPEMCDDSSSNGFSGYAADLWAAGICLYIFTTGTLPFFSFDPSILFDMIAMAVVPYEGRGLSENLIDLLGKLLEKDPSKRAGVGDCLKHTFCAQARIERINTVDCKLMSDENIDTEIKELDAMHDINTKQSSARLNLANLKRERSLRNSAGLAHYSTMKKWCRENIMGDKSSP